MSSTKAERLKTTAKLRGIEILKNSILVIAFVAGFNKVDSITATKK